MTSLAFSTPLIGNAESCDIKAATYIMRFTLNNIPTRNQNNELNFKYTKKLSKFNATIDPLWF